MTDQLIVHRPPPVPPPAAYIDSDTALVALAAHLSTEPLLGIDTESNSMYAYRERVCLIQVSTRTHDYIIDPLPIHDLSPLGPLFAAPGIVKVFHAAEYDIMCLKRDYDFAFVNLFDTMLAARMCACKNIGLGAVIADVLAIDLDKSHQRDDWGARPLPADALLYAQYDTHFLPALYDHFQARLAAEGHLEEARETFDDLARVRPGARNPFDPEGYWKIAIPNHLTSRQAAIVCEVYALRDALSQQRDVPPFKIMSDKTLAALAINAPATPAALERTEGIAPSVARRYGADLLAAVKRGLAAPLPHPPVTNPPSDPVVVDRYNALREWRKQRAQQRGVESDVILAREALWALAMQFPATVEAMRGIPGLGAWRLATYGEEILGVLKKI